MQAIISQHRNLIRYLDNVDILFTSDTLKITHKLIQAKRSFVKCLDWFKGITDFELCNRVFLFICVVDQWKMAHFEVTKFGSLYSLLHRILNLCLGYENFHAQLEVVWKLFNLNDFPSHMFDLSIILFIVFLTIFSNQYPLLTHFLRKLSTCVFSSLAHTLLKFQPKSPVTFTVHRFMPAFTISGVHVLVVHRRLQLHRRFRGRWRSIIGEAHIHILVFTDCKNNRFQWKLMMPNTNIWICAPPPLIDLPRPLPPLLIISEGYTLSPPKVFVRPFPFAKY